jgi:hypothetical protein
VEHCVRGPVSQAVLSHRTCNGDNRSLTVRNGDLTRAFLGCNGVPVSEHLICVLLC